MKFDLDLIKRNSDLLALAERDSALRRVAGTGGGEWAGACAFCGGRDRFRVQPYAEGGGRWLCRRCTDGKWQDVIAYVMRRESCDFRQACEKLGGVMQTAKRLRATPPPLPRTEPPDLIWQDRAREVIAVAEGELWSAEGSRAREWLQGRGLNDDTLRRWHVGYLRGKATEWRNIAGLSVPCGVIIPCEIGGSIWYLKARRASGEPKYMQVKGGKANALYGADTLRGQSVAVICEGEFDAMLLHQEAGDLVGVATLGSASGRLDLRTWGAYLLPIARLLVSYDLDDSGDHGAQHLTELTARARLIRVPMGDKDVTDAWKAGANLRQWISEEIAKYGIQKGASLPAWLMAALGDFGLHVVKHGAQWQAIHDDASWFEKLIAQGEPTDAIARSDYIADLAAAAIREKRYGEGYPLATAEAWREWADTHAA